MIFIADGDRKKEKGKRKKEKGKRKKEKIIIAYCGECFRHFATPTPQLFILHFTLLIDAVILPFQTHYFSFSILPFAFKIRPATSEDAPALVDLILGLAEYERLRHEAAPDVEALRRHLAPDASPRCEALIAEDNAGRPVGLALYFYNYSTFLTAWGIFLEDLFVVPECRGQGIGMALLRRLGQRAVEQGCRRLDWNVLDWNEPAIGFYKSLGARPMDDWTTMRLTGEALATLGRSDG